MTNLEFKAWIEGYASGMRGCPPSKYQWNTILEKAAEIQGPTYPYPTTGDFTGANSMGCNT